MTTGSRAPTAAAIALASCLGPVGCDGPPPQDPSPQAAALLAEVRAAEYRTWTHPLQWPEAAAGRAPHGAVSDIWIDPTIAAASDRGDPILAWPDGSTIVCDGFTDETRESLAAIMIMRKDHGAWTWAQYAVDDTPLVYGASLACSHCHAAGHDFVRSLALPE